MKRTSAERLLDNLCVDLGFCLPSEKYARLSNSPPNTVNSFTDALFVAEGLDPLLVDKYLYRQVQERVAEYFKGSESDNAL